MRNSLLRSVLLVVCLLLPALSGGQQAAAPAAAVPVPVPVAAAAEDKPPAAWSDPRVVAELAKDCAFDPDELKDAARTRWLGVRGDSVLSCSARLDQSCVYDPCFNDQESQCKPGCTKDCRGCGKQCAADCETCKRGCTDAACRLACATRCATCHESCVRTRDRCTTGTCTEQYRLCREKLKAEWRRKSCKAVCRAYLTCQRPCLKKYKDLAKAYNVCTKPCFPKDNHGCSMLLCGGDLSMGINPEDYP